MSVLVNSSSTEAEERVGRYVVLRPIRKGGMGQLSLAFDTSAGEPVLLKRLQPNSNAELRERFLDEIKLTTELSHPNLVKARESGQLDGRDYLVCDWIDGPDLERLLEVAGRYELPLPPAVAVGIMAQVLAGLGTMHARQCIHRDVSPANIMIGYDGIAHLIDFGITKFEGKRSKTMVGAVPGTQGFIAPELEAGRTATVQSDLYSLAASLYFALTGLKFLDHGVDNNGKEVIAKQLRDRGREDATPLLTFLWRNLHKTVSVRCESATEAAQVLTQAISPADPATVYEYVGRLFAGEKQLAVEQLAEWRKKYGAEPVHVNVSQPSASSTAVVTRRADVKALNQRSASSTQVVARAEMVPVTTGGPSRVMRVVIAAGVTTIVALAVVAIFFFRKPPQQIEVTSPAPPPHPVQVTPLPPPAPVAPPIAPPPAHVTHIIQAPAAPVAPVPAPKSPTASADAKKRLKEAADLIDLGRTNSAREIYTELADDPAVRPQALVGLAKLAYKDGKYSDSTHLASKALSAGAGSDAYMVRASAYLRLGDGARAEADFDHVLSQQPSNEDAAAGKAMAAKLPRKDTAP